MPVSKDDEMYMLGILSALEVVYMFGEESVAREIVNTCDVNELLKVAKANNYSQLRQLRSTRNSILRREVRRV